MSTKWVRDQVQWSPTLMTIKVLITACDRSLLSLIVIDHHPNGLFTIYLWFETMEQWPMCSFSPRRHQCRFTENYSAIAGVLRVASTSNGEGIPPTFECVLTIYRWYLVNLSTPSGIQLPWVNLAVCDVCLNYVEPPCFVENTCTNRPKMIVFRESWLSRQGITELCPRAWCGSGPGPRSDAWWLRFTKPSVIDKTHVHHCRGIAKPLREGSWWW